MAKTIKPSRLLKGSTNNAAGKSKVLAASLRQLANNIAERQVIENKIRELEKIKPLKNS
jgi:hypothetical protein